MSVDDLSSDCETVSCVALRSQSIRPVLWKRVVTTFANNAWHRYIRFVPPRPLSTYKEQSSYHLCALAAVSLFVSQD